jgi:peptide subunit release factor 1 (eRF1)
MRSDQVPEEKTSEILNKDEISSEKDLMNQLLKHILDRLEGLKSYGRQTTTYT